MSLLGSEGLTVKEGTAGEALRALARVSPSCLFSGRGHSHRWYQAECKDAVDTAKYRAFSLHFPLLNLILKYIVGLL